MWRVTTFVEIASLSSSSRQSMAPLNRCSGAPHNTN